MCRGRADFVRPVDPPARGGDVSGVDLLALSREAAGCESGVAAGLDRGGAQVNRTLDRLGRREVSS